MTTMGGKLAWVALFERVSARFVLLGVPAVNLFGWRIPAQHPQGNRIAWVPGDPSGIVGSYLPPRNPGGSPRSLGTLGEAFTIIISGQDPTEPENELLQYSIVRNLRDAWFVAAYHVAHGAFTVRSELWITDRLERRHGAALKMVVELQAAIWDTTWDGKDPGATEVPGEDATVEIESNLLDVTDIVTVKGANVP